MPTPKLRVGDNAPNFTLPDAQGRMVKLSDLCANGGRVIVYFYPKDDTTGCTIEARGFSKRLPQFTEAGATIVGISMDSCAGHQKFQEKHGLTITLLSDPDGKVIESYGALRGGLLGLGRTPLAIIRSTFLVDSRMKIVEALYSVKPGGHAEAMLERVREDS